MFVTVVYQTHSSKDAKEAVYEHRKKSKVNNEARKSSFLWLTSAIAGHACTSQLINMLESSKNLAQTTSEESSNDIEIRTLSMT